MEKPDAKKEAVSPASQPFIKPQDTSAADGGEFRKSLTEKDIGTLIPYPSPAQESKKPDYAAAATAPPRASIARGTGFWDRLTNAYSVERGIGYALAAIYSPTIRKMVDTMIGPVQLPPPHASVSERLAHLEDVVFRREAAENRAKIWLNRGEATIFEAAALTSSIRDYGKIKANLSSAIGAELGIIPSDVRIKDIASSRNPFVKNTLWRSAGLAAVRFLAPLAFLKSLTWGLLAQAGLITIERAASLEETAFHVLFNMMDDVFKKGATLDPQARLTEGLGRAMQRARYEAGKAPLPRDVLNKMQPLLAEMAEKLLIKQEAEAKENRIPMKEMLQGRVNEAVYLLGAGITEDIEGSRKKIQEVFSPEGLPGIARRKWQEMHASIRDKISVGESKETQLGMNKDDDLLAFAARQKQDTTRADGIRAGGRRSALDYAQRGSAAVEPGFC